MIRFYTQNLSWYNPAMRTVFTPDALARSNYKTCKLSEWRNADGDELYLFIFPSEDPVNEINGDGEFVEIVDFKSDLSEVDVDAGFGRTKTVQTTPDTVVYYR